MVAATMGDKSKAAGLTPVGTERPTPAPVVPVTTTSVGFGVDVIIEDIRRHFEAVLTDLEQIAVLMQRQGATPEPELTKEQVADARAAESRSTPDFDESFAAKVAAAQEATFAPEPLPNGHWLCPEHDIGVERKTKSGKTYYVCTKCSEFERL
jgi:hypothetical protein